MKWITLLSLWMFHLYAVTLNDALQHALSAHPLLHIVQSDVTLSGLKADEMLNLPDPIVAISINDIQTDDINNRSLEPMQTIGALFTQKYVPLSKRTQQSSVAHATGDVAKASLEEKKTQIALAIKTLFNTIWRLEELIALQDERVKLISQEIELSQTYNATQPDMHMQTMQRELEFFETKRTKTVLLSQVRNSYQELSYWCNQEVRTIDYNVTLEELQPLSYYQSILASNPKLERIKKEVALARESVALAKLNEDNDWSFSLGYFNRDRFKDYWYVGLSIPLAIHSTQTLQAQSAQIKEHQQLFVQQDTQALIGSQINSLYEKMQEAHDNAKVITDQELPLIAHMIEISDASVQSGEALLGRLGLVKKEIMLKAEIVEKVYTVYQAKAALEALVGEQQ